LRSTHCDILLVAADRQSRALLLAELEEADYDVITLPGLPHAVRALLAGRVRPRLILLDVREDEDATPTSTAQLRDLAPGIPMLILVGAYDLVAWQPLQERVEGFLRRPVTVGDVVEAVGGHLGGAPDRGW
jgi:DNA-binding NtrC family response regulator